MNAGPAVGYLFHLTFRTFFLPFICMFLSLCFGLQILKLSLVLVQLFFNFFLSFKLLLLLFS